MPIEILAVLLATGLGSVIAIASYFFLKNKADIENLYQLHKEDSEKLNKLELLLAGHYYDRTTVDELLKDFKGYLNERFNHIEKLMDRRIDSSNAM